MNEPAIDLGIILALISSYKEKPIDERTICLGEVGLSGEVRAVNMVEQRVQEARKLGFNCCVIPASNMESLSKMEGIRLIPVRTLRDVIDII